MYNKLREKVNLLLEDVEVLEDQTSEKPEVEKEPETCPDCGKPVDDCECQTAQESVKKPKQARTGSFLNNDVKTEFDDLGTDENYVRIAKQILKRQKKLGKLKSVKVQTLSLDESRKKRLKAAGILMGTIVGINIIGSALDYKANKKFQDTLSKSLGRARGKTNGSVKVARSSLMKDSAKKFTGTTAVGAGLSGLALAASKNNLELVIICDYEYGKKILPLFSLTENINTKKAISTIGSNITKAVKKLQKAQEWAVREDFSQLDFNKKFMTELLIESMEG